MRIALGLLALSTAAACGDDGMLPVGGGTDGGGNFPDGSLIDGGGVGDTGGPDSAIVSGDGSTAIMGRVCLVLDPRKLNTCETTGAGGFTVRLGSAAAATTDSGAFTIVGSGTAWTVSGASIVTSHMLLGDFEIPVITKATYQAMITNNLQGLQLNPGEGSVMVQVLSNGFGQDSAFADSAPSASWEPFYDDPASPTTFVQTATGTDGMVWIPGLDVGTASVTVTFAADVELAGLPIFDGEITFATAIFPPP